MTNRTSALVFILLANIILLVHAVIPHHHHQEQVCIESTHCEDDGSEHHHKNTDPDHEHDGENNADDCILKQIVVFPTNKGKLEFEFISEINNDFPFNDFHFAFVNTKPRADTPIFLKDISHQFFISFHRNILTTSIGLRAPPIV